MNFSENESYRLLIKAIVAVQNEEECAIFLDDLMSKKELNDISQRLLVAKMLSEQAVYSKIVESTGASTATISRVNKTLNYQAAGGYKIVFDRMKEDE